MTPDHETGPLLAGSRAAVASLAALRHRDPAASGAVRAIKLAQITIERFWVPVVADGSDASEQIGGVETVDLDAAHHPRES